MKNINFLILWGCSVFFLVNYNKRKFIKTQELPHIKKRTIYDSCNSPGISLVKHNTSAAHHVVFTTRPDNLGAVHKKIHDNVLHALRSLDRVTVIDYTSKNIVGVNEFGLPILRDMFKDAMCKYRNYDTYTYINGDILIWKRSLKTLDSVVKAVKNGKIKQRFLVSGRRYNVHFNDYMNLDRKNTSNMYNWIKHSKRDSGWAIDMFSVSQYTWGLWDNIPPFVIGRRAFDNHIDCIAAADPGVDWIDASKTIPVLHQTFIRSGKAQFNFRENNTNKADIDYNVRQKWSLRSYTCGLTQKARLYTNYTRSGEIEILKR